MDDSYVELNKIVRNRTANRIISSRYTAVNFLPKNILLQLSKTSNLFFFTTLILLCLPEISPFEPYSFAFAFCIVVGISMIKDGIEDYRRHLEDHKINSKQTHICNNDNIIDVKIEEVNKGDFLIINENEMIPADVIVLRSFNGTTSVDQCFVETSNIDGETNLKKKYPVASSMCDLCKHHTQLESQCQCMKNEIKKIRGYQINKTEDSFTEYHCKLIYMDHTSIICTIKNVLLKGSILKNTTSILCLAVAVGSKAKISRSVKTTSKGRSMFEKRINSLIFGIFVIYMFMLLTTILYSMFNQSISAYISNFDVFKSFFTNYILYTYLIPLSLFVTIEIARIFHALYIENDEAMYYDNNGEIENAKCRNSNVIEDLGLVDFVLTDKTGTLTNNSMELKQYLVNNRLVNVEEYLKTYDDRDTNKKMFIMGMLVCNQIDILNENYEGISQEEISILNVLKHYGYVLKVKTQDLIIIQMKEHTIEVKIRGMLEFTSLRQRQSIIVEYSENDVQKTILFTKGSEQKCLKKHINILTDEERIFVKKLNEDYIKKHSIRIEIHDDVPTSLFLNQQNKYQSIINELNSITEYRALVFVYKELPKCINGLDYANITENQYHILEFGSQFLGSTLIEDSLQEEIPETIQELKQSGIKIWMITGDKKETALCCAQKSNIIIQNNYLAIEGRDIVQILEEEVRLKSNPTFGINSLPIDYNIFKFDSLVIYRATPFQKGRIAHLLKEMKYCCLGIGDGNNDVAMLKESNIGIGIMGKEGNQAGLNSDCSIYRFKHLRRLLIYYGNTTFIRFSKLTLNAFYKNLYFILIQYFFNFYNLGTGFPIYNDIFLNYFNTFYTSLIPISIVLFDKTNTYPHQLSRNMSLNENNEINNNNYEISRCYFTKSIINLNLLFALLQAIICFGLFRLLLSKGICTSNGILGGFGAESQLISLIIFFTVIIRQVRQISFYTIFNRVAIIISVSFAVVVQMFLQDVGYIKNSFFGYNSFYKMLKIPLNYCIFLEILGLMYGMDIVFDIIQDKIILQEYEKIKYNTSQHKCN